MRTGRERAAQAVAAEVARQGLTQADLGIDPSTYRAFIRGETWPWPRTLARIEARLGWDIGTIARIVAENNSHGDASMLAGATDDSDERELLLSKDVSDGAKRRLITRLWAHEITSQQQKPDDPADSGTSQSG